MRFASLLAAVPRLALSGAAALALLGAAATTAAAATLDIDGPAGAAVTVDGTPLGRLPLAAPVSLEPGLHVVTCALRGCELFTADVLITHQQAVHRLYARLIPLRRRDAALYSFVFAGLGQQHIGRPTLGWALTGLEAGGLVAGLAGELTLRNRRDDYAVLYDAYLSAITDQEIVARRAAAAAAWSKVEDAASLRRTGLLVAAGAV
ncbi:MAG: peptidase associated/transthyretin-like domain-containing protein, partial [Candidatus Krumholzibacteriia bacterium]